MFLPLTLLRSDPRGNQIWSIKYIFGHDFKAITTIGQKLLM